MGQNMVKNLYLINFEHLAYQIDNELIPKFNEKIITKEFIPEFSFNRYGSRLIVFILSNVKTNETRVLILQKYSLNFYTLYSPNNDDKYKIKYVKLIDVPNQTLSDLNPDQKQRIKDIYDKYSNQDSSIYSIERQLKFDFPPDKILYSISFLNIKDILFQFNKLDARNKISFLNTKEFIECIRIMQKYTTVPSWFDLLKEFIVSEPSFQYEEITKYKDMGLSSEFINLLFYSTGRPRVDLGKYLSYFSINSKFLNETHSNINIVQSSSILPLTVTDISDGFLSDIYIPVNRYQSGNIGYLTAHGGEQKQWCGTFYYYEPDSPYILYAPKVLVSWNKITACLDLGVEFDIVYNVIYKSRKDWIIFDDDGTDGLPNNMGFSVPDGTKEEQWISVIKAYQNRTLDPYIHQDQFYAAEDELDQIMCEVARDQEIDVLILKYMTGETRIVTEILDTRTRKSSFENILFPPLLEI